MPVGSGGSAARLTPLVVAGGQDEGSSLRQLSYPQGVVVDQLDTVYVADDGNARIMRWMKGATQIHKEI